MTPRQLLNEFYKTHHLEKDGGVADSFVKIELAKKLHFYFPNFDARRKAIALHDIHHLVTEYETTIRGESEISSWEIASGCKKHRAAFFINVSGVMIGMPFNFFNSLKAFARGRRTKNLYHDTIPLETALDTEVAELKKQLRLNDYPKYAKATVADFILFTLLCLFGIVYSLLLLPLLPLVALYSVYVELFLVKSKTA